MASKYVTVVERDDEVRSSAITAAPKLVLALGRGKTGKSTFIRWAAERSLDWGAEPIIGDADRTNATLSAFFANVIRPPSPEDDDVRTWLNDFVDRQIEQRFSAFLDLGGGDLTLKTWARSLDLAPFLEGYEVHPVALHFLSSDLDDLSRLRDIEAIFQQSRTAIILNEGTVPLGHVARTAFEPIINHEIYQAAVSRGAKVMRMPRLNPMHEIDRRRLSFTEAAAGSVKPGQDKIGPVNRQLISIWLREMETSFGTISSWLP